MEINNLVGVYRVIYLVRDGEEVKPMLCYVCSKSDAIRAALSNLINSPDVVRMSLELMLYFDADAVGKIEWLKNDLIEEKEEK